MKGREGVSGRKLKLVKAPNYIHFQIEIAWLRIPIDLIIFSGVWYKLFWAGDEILHVDANILLGKTTKSTYN